MDTSDGRQLKPFADLTARGRTRRLRGVALGALEHYDLDVERVRLITNEFNGIFRIDAASGEKFILRVAVPESGHPAEQFRSEMTWLDALSRHTQLSVPKPLQTRSGDFIVAIDAEGVPGPRWCMVFSWVPGTNLGDQLTQGNVEKHGRLMAEMHRFAATYRAPAGFEVYRYDNVFHFPEPVRVFDDQYREVISASRLAIMRRIQAWAERVIAELESNGGAARVLHGDLHQWNVRCHRGVLSPIDFEDLIWGWPVQDIGISLYYLWANDRYAELRAAFQRGYERVCAWPETEPGQIDAFISARGLALLNTIMASSNPEWIEMIPGFSERTEKRAAQLMELHGVR